MKLIPTQEETQQTLFKEKRSSQKEASNKISYVKQQGVDFSNCQSRRC